MKILLIKLFNVGMMVLYTPLKYLPVNKHKVVFLSRQSNEVNLDFRLIQHSLKKKNKKIKIINLCKRCDNGIRAYIVFTWYLLKSLYHLATANVCVLDSYWPAVSMLKHKKNLTVIQIWHAMGKIKQSGYQSLGRAGGRDAKVAHAMAMHKNYDIIIAGGKSWNPFYCQSFGTRESTLLNCGLPRMDYLLQMEKKTKEKILKVYPEFSEKTVLLYAPTFRRGWEAHWEELAQCIDFERYILILKSHPNQKLDKVAKEVYTCDEFKAVDLLTVCDYLITDYSAIAVEGAVLNKKTYYYVYDYDEYDEKNGLNINLFETMPGCVFRNAKDLTIALERDAYPQEMLDEYRRKYLPEKLGVSTKTISNIIIEKMGKSDENYEIS